MSGSPVHWRRLVRDPVLAAAFGLGAGLAPGAPGTVGTLLAIPLWWLSSGLGVAACLALAALAFVAGVWVCARASSSLGTHDHPGIVIDEVVGYFAALAVVPPAPGWVILSFVVFRLLDVFKPWPINWIDRRVGGGLGVMLDDLVAGVLTGLVVVALAAWTGG